MECSKLVRCETLVITLLLTGVCLLYVSAQEKTGPRKYALVVGVKEYRAQQPLPPLSYTENDAEQLAAVLKEAGFQVTLMTQAAGKEKTRFLPMAEYILDELKALVERPFLKKDDVVLVALAGHGVQFDEEKDGKKLEKFFFCPMDADIGTKGDKQNNLIPLDHLYEQLDKCEAGTRLLMVDACRNDPSRPSGLRSLNSVTRPKLAPPLGGTIAFFSCSANQRAYEDPDLKHGVFFHHMIEGLKGKADGSKDGSVTATELSEYVASETYDFVLNKYGAQQTPEMKGQIRGKVTLAKLAAASGSTNQTPATTTPNGGGLSNFVSGLLNSRQSARQRSSAYNLHQLGIAVHNYEQDNRRLPLGTMQQNKAKVDDRFSWMCALLPHIDQGNLRNKIDFNGERDGARNKPLLEASIPLFINPGVEQKPESGRPGRADYVGWAGVGKDAPLESAPNNRKGVFGYDRATKLVDIVDGTSNTVMISEASKPGAWAHGGTSTIRALTEKPYIDGVDGIGGPFKEGVHLLFADASVKMVSKNIDPSVLEKLAAISDGAAVSPSDLKLIDGTKTSSVDRNSSVKPPTPAEQLKSIGIALHNHEQTFTKLPEGTRRQSAPKVDDRLGWMVDLLPYLEQDDLHRQMRLDSGWNSEANRPITGRSISPFSFPGNGRTDGPNELGRSDYVGWAGVGADAPLESCPDEKKGVFGYERATRARDIHDGLSLTVMVSEASKPGRWAQGGSSTIRGLTQQPYIDGVDGIGSPWKEGVHLLFGDGHVALVSKNVDPVLLEKLATRAGSDYYEREEFERHEVSVEKLTIQRAAAATTTQEKP